MASSMATGVGSSRGDPLSGDRLELLDLDEVVKKVYCKKEENNLLEQQLSQLNHYTATVMAALRCSDANQLDELCQQLTPHPSMMKKELVSAHLCATLKKWACTDDRVAIHKMLGTEIVTVTVPKLIINIHCYEDNYPHLPPKLFVVEQIPNSNMFKIRSKEILFYIGCDPELTNLMLRSSEQEIVKCFRQIQSRIFDTVDRDNIYQNLNNQELIKQTLTCNLDKTCICFMLPQLKQAFRNSLEDTAGGGWMMNCTEADGRSNSTTVIMQNFLSVRLLVEPNKDSGWCVDIFCDDDADQRNLPVHLSQAITAFAREVSQDSVIDAVTKLLGQVEKLIQSRDIDNSDDSSGSADDQFGAFF